MNLKKFKEYMPEILTGVSVVCTVASNILTYRATKKEAEDNDKKHYILPGVVCITGITATIMSNRLSSVQKASLLASIAAVSAVEKKERNELRSRMTEEELAEFDGLLNAAEGRESGKDLYYIQKFGIRFWATDATINYAEAKMDKMFSATGQVGLDDILEFLKSYNKINDAAAQGIRWSYDFESNEEQHMIFDIKPTVLCGVPCKKLSIVQLGARDNIDIW